MSEMTDAGHSHSQSVSVAVFHRFVVADASAGLYDSCYACFVCNLHAIAEGEECVGGHDRAVKGHPEGLSFR